MKILFLLFFLVPFVYSQRTTQQGGDDSTTKALWHLNETSGNTAYDNATNGPYNGTYNGTTLVESCLWGACRDFGGDPDNISVNAGFMTNRLAYTVSLWVKGADDQVAMRIIAESRINTPGTRDWWSIDTGDDDGSASDKITVYSRNNDLSNLIRFESTHAALDGTWHYVAVTSDSTDVLIYIDGVFSATTAYTWDNTNNVYINLTIGSYNLNTPGSPTYGGWFTGQIEEVRVDYRQVSAAEILHRYTSQAKAYD